MRSGLRRAEMYKEYEKRQMLAERHDYGVEMYLPPPPTSPPPLPPLRNDDVLTTITENECSEVDCDSMIDDVSDSSENYDSSNDDTSDDRGDSEGETSSLINTPDVPLSKALATHSWTYTVANYRKLWLN